MMPYPANPCRQRNCNVFGQWDRTMRGLAPLVGLTAILGVVARPSRSWAEEELFVTHYSDNSITVYPRIATGSTAPLRTLSGPATQLLAPVSLAVDMVHNELVVANAGGAGAITVYPLAASGDTAPLRTIAGFATGLSEPRGLIVDTVNNELVVTNFSNNSITVYDRTASGDIAPLRTVTGEGTTFPFTLHSVAVTTTGAPQALVSLNSAAFITGQLLAYQATLAMGSPPLQADIYLGALLPDGVTFLSLVQASPVGITTVLGSLPIPFLANVTLTQPAVPFFYRFEGSEPVGTYFTYAGLAVAGSDPLVAANQRSLAIQAFQFTQ